MDQDTSHPEAPGSQEEWVERCQRIIGYRFIDPALLRLALTHASVAPTRAMSNERMEFLGDAVLDLVICQELYQRDQELLEGQMTKIKSAVVSRQTCADIAEDLGIQEALHLEKGMASGGDLPRSISAAVFESIVGAIYLDGGLGPAGDFILTHMRPYIATALQDEHQKNYKSALQQHAQRKWGVPPTYQLLDEKGPDHNKCFEVAVSIAGKCFPSAWGMTKKDAEQKAALVALVALGVMDEPSESPGP
ncbi:MAG: ribonuclease III [Planctomycetota bacterium]|nr:ribonuclease III [Planctomycetota bacterium]